MKLIIVKDYDEMSLKAAEIFKEQIERKPNSILGLATGSTPEGMYKNLIDSKLNWENITTFNLDEYIGLNNDHPLSYHHYMFDKLFSKININKENVNLPEGLGDIEVNGVEYDKRIEVAGGIDLQILGIGENAHIAFNEPGSEENSGTRRVDLTESTINANSRYFETKEDVPTQAITMGLGTLLKAKKIVLIASGAKKAQAIKDTFEADISTDVPSSFLRKHDDVIIIADEEAAATLS